MVNYHVISPNGDQHWPPSSCDLTPCGFFLLGGCEISCLCKQTTNNSWAQGGDSTCHWRNGATIMRKCHREFRQKSKSLPAESWGEIFRILCSTINGSVCTLQWNKIIGTFWLNVSFYYEIKSYALVGTPYTCNSKIYRHYALTILVKLGIRGLHWMSVVSVRLVTTGALKDIVYWRL